MSKSKATVVAVKTRGRPRLHKGFVKDEHVVVPKLKREVPEEEKWKPKDGQKVWALCGHPFYGFYAARIQYVESDGYHVAALQRGVIVRLKKDANIKIAWLEATMKDDVV